MTPNFVNFLPFSLAWISVCVTVNGLNKGLRQLICLEDFLYSNCIQRVTRGIVSALIILFIYYIIIIYYNYYIYYNLFSWCYMVFSFIGRSLCDFSCGDVHHICIYLSFSNPRTLLVSWGVSLLHRSDCGYKKYQERSVSPHSDGQCGSSWPLPAWHYTLHRYCHTIVPLDGDSRGFNKWVYISECTSHY